MLFYFPDDGINKLQGAIPYSYQLDALGIYQESIEIINGALIMNSSLQKQHADFASMWLHNIKEQGFIK
ncbi:DUF6908 domain-containing protein [Niabella ginsengisoli]|uniref:DUF6908 domain-containing protein n=1 Tax=Niabella ginsengisoli TaxID=522298 RepID=A0ABS9SI57_9BACT|nr:hypothetical protein [Niabella ginsengisoli]MCH5597996.1 hypothetical protein [Niabella ginsengisoli]